MAPEHCSSWVLELSGSRNPEPSHCEIGGANPCPRQLPHKPLTRFH